MAGTDGTAESYLKYIVNRDGWADAVAIAAWQVCPARIRALISCSCLRSLRAGTILRTRTPPFQHGRRPCAPIGPMWTSDAEFRGWPVVTFGYLGDMVDGRFEGLRDLNSCGGAFVPSAVFRSLPRRSCLPSATQQPSPVASGTLVARLCVMCRVSVERSAG